MSNVVRNSIILFVFLILLVIFRFALENRIDALKESLGIELDNLVQKVNLSAERRRQIENAQFELAKLREKQLQQTKVLRKNDSPAITLNYLLTLKKLISKELNFDFVFQSSKADSSTNFHIYNISGEANLNHLKKLIYHLEQQKPIYTIPNISFSAKQAGISDSVRFAITLHSFFDASGSENERISIEPKYFPYSTFQLFKMGVFYEIKDRDMNLPDSEKMEIVALTEYYIIFRNQEKKLKQLYPGDAVQFGRFKEILFEKKEAVFIINKIGIWKNVIVPFQGGTK